jgi:hypothetical protein
VIFLVIGLYVHATILTVLIAGVVLEKVIRSSRDRVDWLHSLEGLCHEAVDEPQSGASSTLVAAVLSSTYGRHYARADFNFDEKSWTLLLRPEWSPTGRPVVIGSVTTDQLNQLIVDRQIGLISDGGYSSAVLKEYFSNNALPARIRVDRVEMLSDRLSR